MYQKEESKKTYIKSLVLGLFIFAKAFVFIDESRIGINMADSEITVSVSSVAVTALLLLSSFLIANVIFVFNAKYETRTGFLFALILADPIFFLVQNNIIKLITVSVILFFVLIMLRNKNTSSFREISLCICLFLSTFLMPFSAYGFVFLVLIIYGFSQLDVLSGKVKGVLSFVFYIICSGGGLVWNKVAFSRVAAFESFLTTASFYDYSSDIRSDFYWLTGIPIAIFGIWFFAGYYKKAEKKKAVLVIGFIILSYVMLVLGYAFNGIKSLYTLNLIVPVAILSLVAGKDEYVCAMIKKINTFIHNHIFLSVTMYAAYKCLTVALMKNSFYVSNIVSYMV